MLRRTIVLALFATTSCAHNAAAPSSTAEPDPALREAYARAYDSTNVADYKASAEVFAAHLKDHPDDLDARARYGKLLYAIGELDRAAAEFAAVVREGSDHLARTNARNAFVALRLLEQGAPAKLRPLKEMGSVERSMIPFESPPIELPAATAEKPMPERTLALAKAADKYFELADGDDTALQTIAFIGADAFFRYGHAREGADRCAKIIARWPHIELAASCARTTVDALHHQSAWAELEKHARAFLGNLSLIGAEHDFQRWLSDAVQVATFNRLRAIVEVTPPPPRDQLIAAAKAFRELHREFPYSPNSDRAIYNALVYFMKAQATEDARGAAETILAQHADSPVAAEAKRVLAHLASTAAR